MPSFTAAAERDSHTGLYVGVVCNVPGAHSQGASLSELRQNLAEVLSMLLEGQRDALAAEEVVIEVAPLP